MGRFRRIGLFLFQLLVTLPVMCGCVAKCKKHFCNFLQRAATLLFASICDQSERAFSYDLNASPTHYYFPKYPKMHWHFLLLSSCKSFARSAWRFNYPNFFKKWANPGLFLFIFILFKHKFYRKTAGINGIQTRIVRVEGEHADHLTTTTALNYPNFLTASNVEDCVFKAELSRPTLHSDYELKWNGRRISSKDHGFESKHL